MGYQTVGKVDRTLKVPPGRADTLFGGTTMSANRVLLVDDDEIVRTALTGVLEQSGFKITTAANVPEALKRITGDEPYDVLLSDLHMPGAGDGLTVVSAMKHANPRAVTLLLSAFPEMTAAAAAILQQTDEILLKPVDTSSLIDVIKQQLSSRPPQKRIIETVATVLERETTSTIRAWHARIETEPWLMSIPMTYDQRCSHLPILFRDLILRLRSNQPIGTKALSPTGAAEHGENRFRQGYTAAMLVEESRMLQVSIFETLQKNLAFLDYTVVLLGVMTIADEVDSQLSLAMRRFSVNSLSAARAAGA
jgi:CheY-like chemotaxis protein